MKTDFTYRPLTSNVPFHRSTTYERALFGAFGSGKTYAAVAEGIAWLLEQPGIRGLFARKTVPELRDTLEPIFMSLMPADLLAACEVRRTGGHIESITLPTGSVALFRSLDDWNKHRSLNLGFMVIDEANEVDEDTYQGMLSRIRQRDLTEAARKFGYTGEITRRGVWCATNAAGHDWMYKRFVDEKLRRPNTEYFTSTSLENPFLPPEYLESLLAFPEAWVRRYVLCSFDDFAGQIYEDWSWDTHVIPTYTPPADAVYWMALDPGTRNNNAGLWVHVDQEKRRLVACAEYLSGNMAATLHAAEFRKIEAKQKMRNLVWRVSDPASLPLRDRGSNMALRDQYRRLGFNFSLGPRLPRDRVPMLGQLITLQRFVVMESCPMTYEQIRDYRWADLSPAQRAKGEDPKDVPFKKDEHFVDCAQYLSSRWIRAPRHMKAAHDETFSQEAHRIIRAQQKRLLVPQGHGDLGMPM